MRLRLRLLLVLLSALRRSSLRALDSSVLRLRVLPNDVDVSRITNDRYLALMDLGRLDLSLRIGLLGPMLRGRWVPVATDAAIRYRHPLRLFERYELHTRIVWWDDDTFYFEQQFERRGRVTATAYIRGTMMGPDGAVPVADVLAAAGDVPPRPPQPESVAMLTTLQAMIRQEQAAAESSPS
jgi:acyl-CoA thioesterase FadM